MNYPDVYCRTKDHYNALECGYRKKYGCKQCGHSAVVYVKVCDRCNFIIEDGESISLNGKDYCVKCALKGKDDNDGDPSIDTW